MPASPAQAIARVRRVGTWLCAALLTMAMLPVLNAAERAGVTLADRELVDVVELVLNGIGVREYGIFGIDGYVAGLYLPEPTTDSESILDDPGPKLLVMEYVRGGGDRDDVAEVWLRYLRANCRAMDCDWPEAAVSTYLDEVAPAVAGQRERFAFVGSRVDYSVDGVPRVTVDDAVFARILLATWIGPEPSTRALRDALLGLD